MAVQDLERIEQKIDRAAAGAILVSDNIGGIAFESMSEVLEFAKLMSVSKNAVPAHLRGEPGTCLAVCIQALEWRMSPFAVANKSYEVNSRVAYESQLIHAVVEARAPIKQRLRKAFDGEGGKRRCTVTGHFKGEVDPVTYTSPEFDKITPKNSPLWKSDPDQQLWYYSVRAWARANCPDVLLGIYAADELEDANIGAGNAKDITPSTGIKDRLRGNRRGGRGFDHAGVTDALDASASPPATSEEAPPANNAPQGEPTQLDLSADVETEMAGKRKAVDAAETQDDLGALVSSTTEFLKAADRTDLLADFLSHASKREKKLKG